MRTALGRSLLTMLCGTSFVFAGMEPAKVKRDPRAVAVVEALAKTVSPEGAWDKLAGLSFTSVTRTNTDSVREFQHIWDLKSGKYRLEGKGDDAGERIVIFDVATRKGEGWVKVYFNIPPEPGHEADPPVTGARWFHPPGPPQTAYLKFGYGRYLDDTYWLLMPLKLMDPRVELDYEGEQVLEKEAHDVVKVVFDKSGSPSWGDTVWVYVSKKTHLIDRCDVLHAATQPGAAAGGSASPAAEEKGSHVVAPDKGADAAHGQPPDKTGSAAAAGHEAPGAQPEKIEKTIWLWQDWKRVGPLRLSTTRVQPDGSTSITFKDIEALTTIPPKAFETPTKPRTPWLAQPAAAPSQK